MADTSKKRSRKSKLVPRDCGENEGSKNSRMEEMTKSLLSELETEETELDSLPNPLYTLLPKLRTQLDRTYDEPSNSATDIQFCVKIEVEECDESSTDIPEISKTEECDVQIVSNEIKNSDKDAWPLQISETQYRTAVEKSSKITRSLADKILEVHISNYLGRNVNEIPHEMDIFEKNVQDVLLLVRSWTKVSKLRDSVLSYKCYVCDIGWWHLGPFAEHIKEHGEDINLNFQTTPNEGCIVAYLDTLCMREIPIEGRCWQCLKTWDQHVNLKRNSFPYYNCPSCTFRSPTCQPLFEHEGRCVRYQKEHLKDALLYESGVCPICKINCLTQERYNLHMTLTHFVRSDFLCTPIRFKKCQQCPLKYVYYAMHCCPGRPLNMTCYYCMRRFSGKFLVELHMEHTKKNVCCRICNTILKTQCMEVGHVIKHTKNYVLLYKCLVCTDLYFNDEDMVKSHRVKVHPKNRNSKTIYFEEMVIVPRKLVPKLPRTPYNEDEMIAPIHPHILGPKLARIPKPRVNLIESGRARGETESAVDTIRSSHLDVHGHDYLHRPYSSVEKEPPMPTPNESQQEEDHQLELQQQEIDASIAAIASIQDVNIKTETDNYNYYDQSPMDIVYDEVDVKKEQFLNTLTNAFEASESIAENIDDEALSSVIQMSKAVTVIKSENQVSDDHDSNVDSNDVPVKRDKKGQTDDNDDDSDEDVIELKNSDTDDVIELDSSSSSSSDDEVDDDDVSIVKNEYEIIDVSDTEMPSDDDVVNDVNKTRNDDVNESVNENRAKARNDDVSETNNENIAKSRNDDVNESINENPAKTRNDDDEVSDDEIETNNENLAEASDDDTDTNNDDDEIEKTANEHVVIKVDSEMVVKTTDDISDDDDIYDDIEKAIDKAPITTINVEKTANENVVIKVNSEVVVNATDDISDDDVNRVIKLENDPETSKATNKKHKKKVKKQQMYECKACKYKGVHSDYSHHKKFKCPLKLKRVESNKDARKREASYNGGWTSYPCTKCNETFTNLKGFVLHLYEAPHDLPINKCPVADCEKVFNQYHLLFKHVHSHIKLMFTRIYIILEENTLINSKMDNVYQCRKCMEVVKYRKFFKHWEGHLKEAPKREVKVECTIERTDGDDEGLLDNMELSLDKLNKLLELLKLPVPTKVQSHLCVLCRRSFSRGPYLKRHYVEHLLRDAIWRRVRFETENIACQLCREEFSNNLNYKQHMRNHASLPVYRCELCARGFSDSSNFAKHKKVHNMAEAVCDVCGAKFAKRQSLVKHMKLCARGFSDSSNFAKQKKVHNMAEAVCDVCGAKFAKRQSLVKHMKIHLSDPFKCEQCGKTFHSPNQFKKHLRSAHSDKPSSFSCYVCLQKLPSTRERLDHLWTVHHIRNRRMDCPICNRSFRKFLDLKYHLHFKHNAKLTLTSKQFINATDDVRKSSLLDLGYRKNGVKCNVDKGEILEGELIPKAEKVYKNNSKVKSEKDQSAEMGTPDFCLQNSERNEVYRLVPLKGPK